MSSFRLLSALVLVSVVGVHTQDIGTLIPPLFPLQKDADSVNLFPMASCGRFRLEEATIDEMQAAMHNGTLTSVQLVTCYSLRKLQVDEYIK